MNHFLELYLTVIKIFCFVVDRSEHFTANVFPSFDNSNLSTKYLLSWWKKKGLPITILEAYSSREESSCWGQNGKKPLGHHSPACRAYSVLDLFPGAFSFFVIGFDIKWFIFIWCCMFDIGFFIYGYYLSIC